jgi:hypothetical protein
MINTRKPIRESTKKEISYRQSYKCLACSQLLPPSFQIDHIIPWSLSHDDSEENLQALCANCHSVKTQKEYMRIIQYKRLLDECPKHTALCWFCLETSDENFPHNDCDKVLKDITKLIKTQTQIRTNFEEMCEKYRYVKKKEKNIEMVVDKDEEEKNILKIKIAIYSQSIYVNNVIVKFTDDDFTINHIVDAVFTATRSKTFSKRYEIIHMTIEASGNNEEKEKEACMKFIEDSDIVSQFPPRIFVNPDDVMIIYFT